jgi:hypothetical protein
MLVGAFAPLHAQDAAFDSVAAPPGSLPGKTPDPTH